MRPLIANGDRRRENHGPSPKPAYDLQPKHRLSGARRGDDMQSAIGQVFANLGENLTLIVAPHAPELHSREHRAEVWRELRALERPRPVAPTFEGELRRNFNIGQNQGELAFDVGSLFVGGPAAKAVKGLERVSNVGNVERYVAQGFSPKAAAHLAEPYPEWGMGHHFIPRRMGLPESYRDSVFNVLKPEGISRGDFYELHYKVDPSYKGGSVKGEKWNGEVLGLKKYGLAGRIWHGSPPPLKARVGGLGAGAGAVMYIPDNQSGER